MPGSPEGRQDDLVIHDASAASSTDLWVVGEDHCGPGCGDEYVAHWNGKDWQSVPYPTAPCAGDDRFLGVAAVAPRDVWIVGADQCAQLLEHWDGTRLRLVRHPTVWVDDVDASSPTNVWAVGQGAERWNGARWIAVATPPLLKDYGVVGVEVVSPRVVVAAGANVLSNGFIAVYTR